VVSQPHLLAQALTEHNIAIAFPAVYLAQRLPTGKFSAVAIMIWGLVTMSTAGVKTYPGFMVQRFSSSPLMTCSVAKAG
jgi:hypothetical protein